MDKVQFLVNETGEQADIFAYFPDLVADNKGNKTCYSHIGQHSACSEEYANESRKATKEESQPLSDELISIGYDLQPIKPTINKVTIAKGLLPVAIVLMFITIAHPVVFILTIPVSLFVAHQLGKNY